MASHFARPAALSEGRAALWGGAVAGALAGLKADLATGGLTLGGGLLAGGVLGALGAAGAVRGFNKVRGLDQALLAWDAAVLQAAVESALLTYLAVAHHGRGRGEWAEDDPPTAWTAAVAAVLDARRADWQALWAGRAAWLALPPQAVAPQQPAGAVAPPCAASAPADFQMALAALLAGCVLDLLTRLYPAAADRLGLAGWVLPSTGAAVTPAALLAP